MAMHQLPQISESELTLMKIIWENGDTALYAYLMEELERRGYGWKKNTVLTFLSRLVDKKMLAIRKIGRRNEYTALIRESDYQSEQTKQFLDRVYDGNVKGLVNMLVQGDLVSDSDAETLRTFWEEGQADE